MSDYAIHIDWSTVSVTADNPSLVYSVKLTDDADDYWINEFDRLRDLLRTDVAGVPKGFWVNSVSRFAKELTGGMDPGDEDQARRILDDLVERANIATVEAREAETDKVRQEAARLEELQRAAQRATEILRAQEAAQRELDPE
jgi:polyhydroxyalkanoate synthesis regulator phasin